MTKLQVAAISAAILSSLLGVRLCAAHPTQAPAAATVQFPTTPVGEKAKGFIEAINSGDAEKLAAFVKAHYPGQAGNPQGRMIQERTKGLDLVSVDNATDHELTATLKSRQSGANIKMRVGVETKSPHVIHSLGLLFQ